MSKLTIIIPFLNEGVELENTLRSIRANSDENVDILVINDASADGVDYGKIARKYAAVYIKNKHRLGVAASRDLGVKHCKTPYFLLLDAHMRFYDKNWVDAITSELQRDERTLLCCQTKVLTKENDSITEHTQAVTFGAYLDFSTGNAMQLHWKNSEHHPENTVEDIPCVLGAGYACAKWYWQHLNGLQGLRYYGCDEAYISLKVWLEGGRCKLLKNVLIGHIYRSLFPYQVSNADIFYNQMLIAESLLPYEMKIAVFARLKKESGVLFEVAERLFSKNSRQIAALKNDYRRIFTQEFLTVIEMNRREYEKEESLHASLQTGVNDLILKSAATDDVSLYYGKMGLSLLLYHYGHKTQQSVYHEFAGALIDQVYQGCQRHLPVDFANGICGIGWAVSSLINRRFVKGKVNEILRSIDKKVMERDLRQITDWSFRTGLNGILCYVLTRFEDIRRFPAPNPFDESYLLELHEAALRMLGDPACREDTTFPLAYVAYAGNPEISAKRFEIPDFIDFSNIGAQCAGATPFDIEKGGIGTVFKDLFKIK